MRKSLRNQTMAGLFLTEFKMRSSGVDKTYGSIGQMDHLRDGKSRTINRFMMSEEKLAPRAGFEPATNRLTVDCSTAELSRNTNDAAITKAKPVCQAPNHISLWRFVGNGSFSHHMGCREQEERLQEKLFR
jgi:hypothetical protein